MLADLLTRICTVENRVVDGTNNYGRETTTAVLVDTVCEFQQQQHSETDQDIAHATWLLILPAGTRIGSGDAVMVDGLPYEVQGEPWRARHPITRIESHIEATLVRTGAPDDEPGDVVTVTPDIEQAVRTYLLTVPAVTAITNRIVDTSPRTTSLPWVRITQVGDQPADNSRTVHLIAHFIQVDCFAGDDPDQAHSQASTLARTVRGALDQFVGTISGGVVTGVRFERGTLRLPDIEFAPPEERFILNATIWAHP